MIDRAFKHVISLGWFCSTALEIERIGLRDASYPFDWLLTHDFGDVLKLIETHFENWLSYDDMLQYEANPAHWYNRIFKISFYHDFKKNKPLKNQLFDVTEKYNRRVGRVFTAIKEPTLFIRYIYNQNEADIFAENFRAIEDFLKQYNSGNEIIYVTNAEIKTNFEVFAVEKDNGDNVARRFMEKSALLFTFLQSGIYDAQTRKHNIDRYKKKQRQQLRLRYYFGSKRTMKSTMSNLFGTISYTRPLKRELEIRYEFKLL